MAAGAHAVGQPTSVLRLQRECAAGRVVTSNDVPLRRAECSELAAIQDGPGHRASRDCTWASADCGVVAHTATTASRGGLKALLKKPSRSKAGSHESAASRTARLHSALAQEVGSNWPVGQASPR